MASSNTTAPSTCRIVRFFDPAVRAPDSRVRTLDHILAWDDSQLEYCHDYIQWLFPLPERSPIAPSAPRITHAAFDAFRARDELRSRMREALGRICVFYGFKAEWDDAFQIEKLGNAEFQVKAGNWVTRFNHNHLRITRIIRSLRVLGLEEEAAKFFAAVADVHRTTGRISDRSLMFWRRAAERPLYLAPEDEEDKGEGASFLYEYEGVD